MSSKVNENDQRIADLQAQVAALQVQVDALIAELAAARQAHQADLEIMGLLLAQANAR